MAPPVKEDNCQSQNLNNHEDSEEEYGTYLNLVAKLVHEHRLPEGQFKKVVDFKHPKELEQILELDLKKYGINLSKLEDVLEDVITYSVKTADSRFYNQFYQGIDEVSLAGTWLSEALNTNQHTFEVAPVFMVIERLIIKHLRELMDWASGDGIFCPGGSIGNMYGMAMARYKKYPDIKKVGMAGKKPLVVLTSEECHYSILKGAHWLGLGTDNVRKVKTDHRGRMIATEIEKEIQASLAEGKEPFLINATAGTTVIGAYDSLSEIADICERYKIWLHVDGAWGGSAILTPKYKHLLAGIERCDSFVWNPHKMLGVPLQCTVFVTRHKDMLLQCNSAAATYLFQQDKFYDVTYDSGDKSFQCGRKVDSFKLWIMWKVRGEECLAKRVNGAFDMAKYLRDLVAQRPSFRLVVEDIDGPNVCFWYIPKRLRGQNETKEWWQEINKVAPAIKEKMVRSGSLMIGYQPLPCKNLVNFFRVVVSSMPTRSHQDIEFLLSELERLGEQI